VCSWWTFWHLGRTKILQLPNSEIGFTNPFFNFNHSTSIRTTRLATSVSATQLQLCQRDFNFANATSTLPVQLQLGQDDFNFTDATSTLYSQSQFRVRASILTVIHRYSILSSHVMAYRPFGSSHSKGMPRIRTYEVCRELNTKGGWAIFVSCAL
jgi:hypothetical protein